MRATGLALIRQNQFAAKKRESAGSGEIAGANGQLIGGDIERVALVIPPLKVGVVGKGGEWRRTLSAP